MKIDIEVGELVRFIDEAGEAISGKVKFFELGRIEITVSLAVDGGPDISIQDVERALLEKALSELRPLADISLEQALDQLQRVRAARPAILRGEFDE